MKSRPLLLGLALAAGLGCAVVLWQVWRAESENSVAAAGAPAAVATPNKDAATPTTDLVSGQTAALSAEARALLAAVQRLLLGRRDARANEAVFSFKDDAAYQRFLTRATKAGLNVIASVPALRSVRVSFADLAALQRELAQNAADYEEIAANSLVSIPQPPAKQDRAEVDNVPFRNRTLEFLGANGDRTTWGRGTTIAILDTGVASDVTFGAGRLRTLDIGLGTAPGAGSEDGHGTAIAALAAGLSRDAAGVAPAANLLSIRVTDASGTSDIFTLAQGIVAAVDAGAQIVNVSLGGYATNSTLSAALAYASDHGALVVAAAGNDQAAQLAWPAADSRVLSVGAVDAAEQQVSFSNSGPQLSLTAPGYGVQTAWLAGQRIYMDGTSASSPLVAGAVAAVMSQNPSLTPQQAAQVLTATASDGGAPGADPAFGNGILNLGWAMNRDNPAYVDTAIAGHSYDAAGEQMQFTVQNRSGRAVTGMTLDVTAGGTTRTQTIPSLAPGESYVVTTPVDELALKAQGSLNFSTRLNNPLGTTDQVPANNQRASTLTAPAPKP